MAVDLSCIDFAFTQDTECFGETIYFTRLGDWDTPLKLVIVMYSIWKYWMTLLVHVWTHLGVALDIPRLGVRVSKDAMMNGERLRPHPDPDIDQA